MSGRFFHIYLDPKAGVSYEQIVKTMNLGLDWYKYDKKVWVVYTTSDFDKWKTRLEPLAKKGGNYFVAEIDVTKRTGWMAKSFWEWLKKERK